MRMLQLKVKVKLRLLRRSKLKGGLNKIQYFEKKPVNKDVRQYKHSKCKNIKKNPTQEHLYIARQAFCIGVSMATIPYCGLLSLRKPN
jgi:hypothetical protein